MSRFVTRLFAAALITLGGVSLSAVTFEAQAARALFALLCDQNKGT